MRAPSRRREMRRTIVAAPAGVILPDLAGTVRYVGSAEHKSAPSFAGQPKLRADASKCDPSLQNANEITQWLRSALRAGNVGGPWEGGFPRYVWCRHGDMVFEGRLVNRGLGSYKGYPLVEEEWPSGL